MPLIHSKKPSAFKQNIKTEMAHGKPQKQAVAIAYSEKHKAERKHYDQGGKATNAPKKTDKSVLDTVEEYLNNVGASTGQQSQQTRIPQVPPDNKVDSASSTRQDSYAHGGEVEPSLHDMAADELMDALESKDKTRVMDCMRACMATMHGDED